MPMMILTKVSATMKTTKGFGMNRNVTINITATALPTVCNVLGYICTNCS